MGLAARRRRLVSVALMAALAVVLSLATGARAALTEESFAQKNEGRPELAVSGETLSWEGTDPTGTYLVKRMVPEHSAEYAVVKGQRARPPVIAGETVGYRVKGILERTWSPEVSVAYGTLPKESVPAALSESAFVERIEGRPGLTANGAYLRWTEADPTGDYMLQRTLAGREPEYAFVRGLRAKPPAIANSTVVYRVKGVLGGSWSPEVSISYSGEGQPEEEEPPNPSVVVNAAPTGPATPEGGWHVAFADGFGAALGTEPGQDNFIYPNQNACCNPREDRHGNNPNELEVYNGSQVRVGEEGLELIDRYAPKRAPAVGPYPVRNYVSGSISTQAQYAAGGYHPFVWRPNGGETWAFECNCRLPSNSPFAGVDPGWWSTDPKWTNELDFFEEWGWGTGCELSPLTLCLTGVAWVYDTSLMAVEESYKDLYSLFDPTTGFHRYTTVIYPNNSWSEYIDGQLQRWVGINGVAPPPPYDLRVPMSLLLTNALRDQTPWSGPNPYPGFSSGSRTFTARSIAVYEDGAHAGQDVSGGGVAPGTSLK